ncbi:hypothetical protein Tco_0385599, partial [Tanacetum coccineum]
MHSYCMTWLEQLEIHLCDLYLDNLSHAIDAFKPGFHTFFGEEHQTFRRDLLRNLDILEMAICRAIEKSFKLQSKDVQINPVQVMDANLVVTESSGIESKINSSENALSKSVNETQMHMQKGKVDMESSGTKSDEQDTRS